MSLIKKLSSRLQNHPKRVVFPEGADPRIIEAARQFSTRKLGVPILLGNKAEIEALANSLNIRLDGIKIITPELSDDFDDLFKLLGALPKFKQYESSELVKFAKNTSYYATLMLATGRADAMVAGATMTSSSALRPVFKIIQLQKNITTASSMMVLDLTNNQTQEESELFLADCAVIPEPTEQQLCDIAITTANFMAHLTLKRPKVAMLSYASKSNVNIESILKMRTATAMAHKRSIDENLEFDIDGELQVDAALSQEVANAKGIKSSVAGKANVLVFPDLNSANIASKMVQMLSDTHCYGQILTGFSKPIAEISRGASVEDIFGTSVIVAAQAVDRRFLSVEKTLS